MGNEAEGDLKPDTRTTSKTTWVAEDLLKSIGWHKTKCYGEPQRFTSNLLFFDDEETSIIESSGLAEVCVWSMLLVYGLRLFDVIALTR